MFISLNSIEPAIAQYIDMYFMDKATSNIQKGVFACTPMLISSYINSKLQNEEYKNILLSMGISTVNGEIDLDKAQVFIDTFMDAAQTIPIEKQIFNYTLSLAFDKEDIQNFMNLLKQE